MLGRTLWRRLVIVGVAALLAAPAFVIQPAFAAVVFSCGTVTGSATLSPGLVHDKRPQILESGPTALTGPADITLASITGAGVKGNGQSDFPSLSADGTKVAFISFATNLDPADTGGGGEVYVKDLTTDELTLVSTAGAGLDTSLSADGTKVAFVSYATNLDPRDNDGYTDVYVKDLTTGALTLASTSNTGVKGDRDSSIPSLSADGSKVAFLSRSLNLHPADPDNRNDVYVKNLRTGNLRLASTSDAGVKANASSFRPTLSGDGRRVAFDSNATNLDPRATNASFNDVYVKNLSTGDLTLASTSDTGVKGNQVSFDTSLSADGTRVAFNSWATNLDPGDRDGQTDLYVKDLTTGNLILASTSDTGVKGGGNGGSLSADGTRVAFQSEGNLDPVDTSRADIYVKDLTTGNVVLASTSDTGVRGNAASESASLSADGTTVAFGSQATNFEPADTDTVIDTYAKTLPSVGTSLDLAGCSNAQTGRASVAAIKSFSPRPLGCPQSLGGAAGNDYADTTPILVGANPSFEIDWASGPNSYGVAAVKAGPTGTQWRVRLTITASPGHDTPATNQYLPAAGSGFTKTRLQGKVDVSALDSFNCANGVNDPISWLKLVNNGSWVAMTR